MIQVTPTLWRGPRPKDLAVLQAQGFERIISLESGWYELLTDTKRERQFPCEFGLEYYDLGCSDIWPPDKWTVSKAIALISENKKTYIHCLSGVDRTGFVCAAYRMWEQHWTFKKAHDEWVSLGRHWWYFWWSYALHDWRG